jgi:hypothetical protein
MTFAHPPNKREFVEKGGLSLIVKVLRTFGEKGDCEPLIQQALSLLCCVISDDDQAKMSMSLVRQSVVAEGTTLLLEGIEKSYKDSAIVQQLTQSIWRKLMTDYS